MRVGIIGAGVVGVTTAHALYERGCDVTILEAEAHAGLGASYANAGQLAYGHATPLGSPAILRQVVNILLGRAKGVSVGLGFDRRYLEWVLSFLWQCLPAPSRRNTEALALLARRSEALMQSFHNEFGCDYQYARAGKIVLDDGVEGLDREALVALEPALASWQLRSIAGTYAMSDEVGDARRFTTALALRLAHDGVTFLFGHKVESLHQEKDGWRVATDQGECRFDRVIICNGYGAVSLLAPLGMKAPVFPVAGFSYTFPAGTEANTCSVTISEHRLVFSRIGDQVRIAGFASVNKSPQALLRQAKKLLDTARRIAPSAAAYDDSVQPWIGFRPATPSSLPMVGQSPRENLYYNFGHGMLGWTLSAATADQVAEQVVAGAA